MKRNEKIAIIGTVGLPANYGGFETLADHLVKNLGNEYDFTVYCSGLRYERKSRTRHYGRARLVYLPLQANGIQSMLYDSLSIIHALLYADVLLILGVAGAWILPFVRLLTKKKVIVSIDGIEWKREKWNMFARCYLWWAEKIAVKYSHIDISDNESIQDYTALRYGSLSRIVEYGADHTLSIKPSMPDRLQYPFLNRPYAFKVCRIEPENNVHVVLDTFKMLSRHTFVIVGNWNNSSYGRNLRKQFNGFDNIIMLDPIYDQRSLDMLRGNAIVYIHGHSAGGTNPSLVEAMYLGLPVVAYHVSYNRTTTEGKALYFKDAKSLQDIITGTPVCKLKQIGITMKRIADRRYTWSNVCRRYAYLINEALTTPHKVAVVPEISSMRNESLIDLEAGHLKYVDLFYEKR